MLKFIEIGYYSNENIAFGIPFPSILIIVLTVIAITLLVYLLVCEYKKKSLFSVWGINLMVWGALSNLYDRVMHGFVVDYINIQIWPVFNLADVMIVVGAAIILYAMLVGRRKNKK